MARWTSRQLTAPARTGGTTGPPTCRSALVGDSEALASLGATPFQDDTPVLGRHADAEPVRLGAAAGIRLVRALALHLWSCKTLAEHRGDWPRLQNPLFGTEHGSATGSNMVPGWRPDEFSIVSAPQRECQRATPCVTVAGRDQRRIRHRGIRAWVGSQRFPQLWKTLWKSGRSWLDSRKTFGFPAIFGGRKRDSADSAAVRAPHRAIERCWRRFPGRKWRLCGDFHTYRRP